LKRGLVPVGDSREGRIYLSATPQELKELGLPEGWAGPAPAPVAAAPVAAAPSNRERKPKWNGRRRVLTMRHREKTFKEKASVILPIIQALHDDKWRRLIEYAHPPNTSIEVAKKCVRQAFEGYPLRVTVSCGSKKGTWTLTWDWR